MKISECSFCGLLAITQNDVCSSCQAFVAPEHQAAAGQNPVHTEANVLQPASQTALNPAHPATVSAPVNEYAPPPFQNRAPRSDSYQSSPAMDARCLRCKTLIPRGQSQCFDCENRKKSSPLKFIAGLVILVGVVGFFSFDYVYASVSPHGIFRKYAKTTGADDSLVFENFTLKGETRVSVTSGPSFNGNGFSGGGAAAENFSFKMVFKKPNLSSIEFTREGASGSYTAFKQVFDGTRGWKYTNMPNQPAGYQDTEDAFGYKKMGMGMDDFESLEFLNDKIAEEYGRGNIKTLTDIEALEVADLKKPTGEKTVVLGKLKRNGKTDAALLVFDGKSGLLIGMLKKDLLGSGKPLYTTIFFDKYAKFPVKRKGWFGVAETTVLVPTKMSFVTRAEDSLQFNGMPTIGIDLTVKEVETDASVEDSYFQKQ